MQDTKALSRPLSCPHGTPQTVGLLEEWKVALGGTRVRFAPLIARRLEARQLPGGVASAASSSQISWSLRRRNHGMNSGL